MGTMEEIQTLDTEDQPGSHPINPEHNTSFNMVVRLCEPTKNNGYMKEWTDGFQVAGICGLPHHSSWYSNAN
jgi:hypothetical protein